MSRVVVHQYPLRGDRKLEGRPGKADGRSMPGRRRRRVVLSLTIRPFPNWGGLLASGVVGILLASVLWANLPVTGLWLIGLLLGIELISVGAAMACLAWNVHRS